MKKFGLVGAAGYIAPRHMKAIKDTNNELIAAVDPNDLVGIIDSYFPEASFFTEIERFDRHLERQRRKGNGIDFISICSPNYLHDAHIRLALRLNAHAICEKPIVIRPWNIDALEELESEFETNIYTILQLRLLPSLQKLKKEFSSSSNRERVKIDLKYITRRGKWYQYSWKGDQAKSGGIMMNIGVHFFDLLGWLFGDVQSCHLDHYEATKAKGSIQFDWADVNWFLSVDGNDLPDEVKAKGKYAYRSMTMNGQEIEFSAGFTELHTESYKEILSGNGFRINETRKSINLIDMLRRTI